MRKGMQKGFLKNVVALSLAAFVVGAGGAILADEPLMGRDGRAEVRFLEGMMDHHQMALDMANDCLTRASTDDLRTMCEAIIAAQSVEIAQMQAWLLDWYNVQYAPMPMMPMESMNGMEGMNMATPEAMLGMDMGNAPVTDPVMMMGMMAGLSRAQGVDYDIAFLESMIDHHDDALHMSERILIRTVHPETTTLAEQIIADQTAEIAQMETMLSALGNGA